MICILLTYKHDNQTRGGFGLVSATGTYLSLGTWFFPKFQLEIPVEQEFLFNGKRVKCLRRNVGPARMDKVGHPSSSCANFL